MENKLILYCDGATKGNPGASGVGAVLYLPGEGEQTLECSLPIGEGTNNMAEYVSLLAGLETAANHLRATGGEVVNGKFPANLEIRMDSQLVVEQVRGRYQVKNERLRFFHGRALASLARFDRWSIEHVPREQNRRADALASAAVRG